MKEKKFEVNLKFSQDFPKNLAKYSNFKTRDSITELVDNGREAMGGTGTVKIAISGANIGEMSFYCEDRGCGMSIEDVENLLSTYGIGDDEKIGVHPHMGGKNAMNCLFGNKKGAYASIITHKEGFDPIRVIWDGGPVLDGEILEEDIPIGTSVSIYGTPLTPEDADEFKAFAAVRYSEPLSKGFHLIVDGEEITPEDPIYLSTPDPEGVEITFKGETEVYGPVDGLPYIVKYTARDLSYFVNPDNSVRELKLNSYDIDGFGNCRIKNNETSGVFLKVGDIFLVVGGATNPYIKRVPHNQMNGKRIVIEFPEALAKQMRIQMNKSTGFVEFERVSEMRTLIRDMSKIFEKAVQGSVQRGKKENEDAVLAYKDVKHLSDGTEIRFKVNHDIEMSKNTFAIKQKDNSYTFNPDSELLRPVSKSLKNFRITAGVAESIIAAFYDSVIEANKFQPSFTIGAHAKSVSVSARNQTLEKLTDVFKDKILSLSK